MRRLCTLTACAPAPTDVVVGANGVRPRLIASINYTAKTKWVCLSGHMQFSCPTQSRGWNSDPGAHIIQQLCGKRGSPPTRATTAPTAAAGDGLRLYAAVAAIWDVQDCGQHPAGWQRGSSPHYLQACSMHGEVAAKQPGQSEGNRTDS